MMGWRLAKDAENFPRLAWASGVLSVIFGVGMLLWFVGERIAISYRAQKAAHAHCTASGAPAAACSTRVQQHHAGCLPLCLNPGRRGVPQSMDQDCYNACVMSSPEETLKAIREAGLARSRQVEAERRAREAAAKEPGGPQAP